MPCAALHKSEVAVRLYEPHKYGFTKYQVVEVACASVASERKHRALVLAADENASTDVNLQSEDRTVALALAEGRPVRPIAACLADSSCSEASD